VIARQIVDDELVVARPKERKAMRLVQISGAGQGLRRALQQRPLEQYHRLHHTEGHAHRASAGDPCGETSEAGGGAKTAADSSAKGRLKNDEHTFRVVGEVDNFRLADSDGRGETSQNGTSGSPTSGCAVIREQELYPAQLIVLFRFAGG
jgi:hypothetical protein